MSSSALAAGLRHLRGKLAAQEHNDASDEQLLHAFLANRDDNAFAVLMRRHGPMVLHVCRRVLGHEQDAEDAFQATFLVLSRQAERLRKKASLSSWLYGTAYRIALKTKRSAARRCKHEGRAITRSSAEPATELMWHEVRTLLDEEIARLPEKYRIVFVLCYLENCGREEMARRLCLKEGTVASRLDAARKRLQRRLARRGVELSAVLAAAALEAQAASALSPLLMATTIKAALAIAAGEGMTAVVSAKVLALVTDATPILIRNKAKIGLVMMLATCALAGGGAWVYRTPALPQSTEQPAETRKSTASKPKQGNDAVVMVHGRVLLPDGKPAANAVIFRRQFDAELTGSKDAVLTTTGADGRFEVEHRDDAFVIASAPGFAPDWVGGRDFKGGKVTLTLAERVSVRGQLISLEGKPIAGVRVKVRSVNVPVGGGNLNAVKDAFRLNPEWVWAAMPKALSRPIPDSTAEAKTDADGRFEMQGFGKNRVVELRIEGDGIVSDKMQVILTDNFDPKLILPRPSERSGSFSRGYHPTVYGRRFTHVVRPCQVITGVVTDQATGKPVVGAKIVGTAGSIRPFDYTAWSDAVEAVTDRDGRYRLHGLAKAKQRYLHMQAGAAPYLDRLLDVKNDAPAIDPVAVDIKLSKAVTIEGRLIDKTTGKGVRGEVLSLLLENDEVRRFLVDNSAYSHEQSVSPSGMSVQSDAEGRFKLHVPPVPLVILARASDATAHYTSLYVAEADRKYLRKPPKEDDAPTMMRNRNAKEEFFDTHMFVYPLRWESGYALIHPKNTKEIVKLAISFDPGRTIHGKIVDPDGRPLVGVEATGIQATEEREPATFRTDAFTVYALDPRRARTVYFRHAAKNLVGVITLRGDEKEPPFVKMQPAAAVVGRVLDAQDKPLAGLEIIFQFAEAEPDDLIRQHHLCHWDKPMITDADGRFRLEGMFPGLEFEVYAGRPGHRRPAVAYQSVTLQAGEVRDLGERREQKER